MLHTPFRDGPFLVLRARSFPPDELRPMGRRYGLACASDGTELQWTLDGEVVDTVSAEGFFGSSPEAVSHGAHASVFGTSCYRRNVWRFDKVKIRTQAEEGGQRQA